ncbi:MAG: 1-acyl-sn-glycerol-3-phosphate acyltransferase [Halobacteriovoraceae bacterium]|nr:1-acyl-sn-glycerol-3-phosphate acyltransferase [Halobacteriovoraceae bacterium]
MSVKAFSKVFYKTEVNYINPSREFWTDINVFSFLNHTSLLEPILFSSVPNDFFFKNMKRTVVPGADITLERPIVGRFYKFVFPQMVSISRKRDDTWIDFMGRINPGSLVVIAPEGRMMRENGLDKNGKPMTIRAGIADILKKTESGYLMLAYSGGLHHVQKPGQKFLRLFKTIKISYEKINIKEYKKRLLYNEPDFHKRLVQDLSERMKKNIPK